MLISPINLYLQNNTPNFRADKKSYYITKDMVYGASKITEELKTKTEAAIDRVSKKVKEAAKEPKVSKSPLELIKQRGITHIMADGTKVNIATGQKGFFTIESPFEVPKDKLVEYVSLHLPYSTRTHNCLGAYIDCVNDLKRQDLVMRGAGITSYQLTPVISDNQHAGAFLCLAKYLDRDDCYERMFFINKNAFFYDADNKTLYKVTANLDAQNIGSRNVTTCKFVTDDSGNVIGYDKKEWDLYADAFKDISYREQLAPSQKLPKIVDIDNGKLFAESYRFGNAERDFKFEGGIRNALEHLENKAKVKNPYESALHFMKFFDKDKNIQRRICYYNPESGRTIVYNDRGQYLYQVEFVKNNDGTIITSRRA